MSETSWACQSIEECMPPTWDHATGHLIIAASMWAVYFLLGIVWILVAPFLNFDFRSTFGRYQYGIASSGFGAAVVLVSVSVFQSFTFAHRSLVGFVEPLLHALEMLCTMVSIMDCSSRWCYVCCEGFQQLLVHCFSGALMVDCMIVTSTISLGVEAGPPGQAKKTWWSFSFLSSFTIFRGLRCLAELDSNRSAGGWKRQIYYALLAAFTGMWACAGLIMSLELLGPERGSLERDVQPGTVNPWDVFDGLSWSISLFTMLGNSARNPTGVVGQVGAIIGMSLAIFHLGFRIMPIAFDLLTERHGYVGRYPWEKRLERNPDGHTIITGSPTARTVWDFLTEFYHPNHFSSGADFEREARDVVVLLENVKVLKHLERLLTLKEAMMFRGRVFLIRGQALSPQDWKRVGAGRAKRAVVLPDMTSPASEQDDLMNIMRAYAMASVSNTITVTSLLHGAQHQGSMLSGSTPNCTFVSIDAIKMNLLGKATMFPGAMALVCNLCVSVGENKDKYTVRRHWMSDYERGLDMELYEAPLSQGYHGCTFLDIFEDVLNRTKGQVYVIGLTDTIDLGSQSGQEKKGARNVLINPGPDYVIKVSHGRTAGVFIAPDIDAIVQLEPGQDLEISRLKLPKRLPRFEREQQKVVKEPQEDRASAQKSRLRPKSAISQASVATDATDFEGNKVTREEKLAQRKLDALTKEVDDKYAAIMLDVKRKFLEKGLNSELVCEATNTEPFQRRFPRTNLVEVKEEDSGSDGEGNEDEAKKLLLAKARNDIMGRFEAKKQELEKLEAVVERVRRDAVGERKPTRALLASGSHVLVCLVGDTEVSSIPIGSRRLTGSVVGIDCFMKALRDPRLELNEGSQPPVVVLSELQPADWYKTANMERVYFFAGSPMRTQDLIKAGIRSAKVVVVVRMHNGKVGQVEKIADARLVLCATMASYLLPPSKIIPIVTDHAYAGSCDLLPKERIFIEEGPLSKSSLVGPPAALPRAITALLAGPKALARSTGLDGKPPPIIDGGALDSGFSGDKYEDLETYDIKYNPRYLRGQVFHPSAVASMVANATYNPTLISMVDALVESPMMLIDVPKVFYQTKYQDFVIWLLRERELLALGLYRSAEASQAAHTGDYMDDTAPTHHFVYTAPPGSKTLLVKTDQVIVTAVGTKDCQPTKVGSYKQQKAMLEAVKRVYKS